MKFHLTRKAWEEVGLRKGWLKVAELSAEEIVGNVDPSEIKEVLDEAELPRLARRRRQLSPFEEDLSLWGKVEIHGLIPGGAGSTSEELQTASNHAAFRAMIAEYVAAAQVVWPNNDEDVYVQVYEDEAHQQEDEPTDAFEKVVEVEQGLKDYPLLDDSDFYERERAATVQLIRDEAVFERIKRNMPRRSRLSGEVSNEQGPEFNERYTMIADWVEDPHWEYDVHRWLEENVGEASDCWYSDDNIKMALRSLGWLNPEANEEILSPKLLDLINQIRLEINKDDKQIAKYWAFNSPQAQKYLSGFLLRRDQQEAVIDAILLSESAPPPSFDRNVTRFMDDQLTFKHEEDEPTYFEEIYIESMRRKEPTRQQRLQELAGELEAEALASGLGDKERYRRNLLDVDDRVVERSDSGMSAQDYIDLYSNEGDFTVMQNVLWGDSLRRDGFSGQDGRKDK